MSEPIEHEPSPELAALLDALAQPARADEVDGAAETVAAMQSVIAPAGTTQGASMHQKRTRVAVLAAAGVILVGGAAAAAGFDPIDRPPSFDPPPVSVPPVSLPEQARRAQQTTTTSTSTTASTTSTTSTTADPTTTSAPTTTAGPTGPATTAVPGEVVCADGNHGKTVSSVAHAVPPGPEHGPAVAAAAQSECGKPADDVTTDDTVTDEAVPAPADDATPAEERGRPDDAGRPDSAGSPADAGRPADPGPPADVPGNTAPGRSQSNGRGGG